MDYNKKFWDRAVPIPECGCLIWEGATNSDGYGSVTINGIKQNTHRLSWKLAIGRIPVGMHILHRCDTPACINPHHLFLGTARDNACDKIKKGRWRL